MALWVGAPAVAATSKSDLAIGFPLRRDIRRPGPSARLGLCEPRPQGIRMCRLDPGSDSLAGSRAIQTSRGSGIAYCQMGVSDAEAGPRMRRSSASRPHGPEAAREPDGQARTAAPSGTITFLFTDIEGSTRLWEEDPEAASEAVRRHDRLMRGAIAAHDGYVFNTAGDSFAGHCCIEADRLCWSIRWAEIRPATNAESTCNDMRVCSFRPNRLAADEPVTLNATVPLLEVPVGQPEPQLPPHRQHDQVRGEPVARERGSAQIDRRAGTTTPHHRSLTGTEPIEQRNSAL